MRVGFTGTREGMTTAQWETVSTLMGTLFEVDKPNEWHDGDCIGADEQAHNIAKYLNLHLTDIELHGHPCNLEKYRAWQQFDVMHAIFPPLVRNRHIVDAVDVMIAAPKEYENVERGSGTWATMRYATRRERKMWVCWPDGTKVEFRHGAGTLFD